MSRFFTWQYVATRAAICVVALLGAQFALGFIAKSVATRQASQILGTQVEIANARVSLDNGHVLLSGVRLGDESFGKTRPFSIESCELELSAGALLHGQTVIERGRIAGLHLGESPLVGAPAAQLFGEDALRKARTRFACLHGGFDRDLIMQLASVQRTTETCGALPKTIDALESRCYELQRQAAELESALEAAQQNSLRHGDTLRDVPTKLAALRADLRQLDEEFDALPAHLDEERRAIVAARRQDEQSLRAKLQAEEIDAKALNAYLLHEQAAAPVAELTSLLRHMRRIVPAMPVASSKPNRGQDVLFAGCQRVPEILVRQLAVQCDVRMMGQSIELHGHLSNYSTSPMLSDRPVQLRLSSAGSTALELRGTFDRTKTTPRDEFFVDCQNIALDEQALGHEDGLRIRLAPAVGRVCMSVCVEGERLRGDIQLVQQDVQITPELGGNMPTLSLDSTLGQISSLATHITLGGTVAEPSCTLWSNLGPAVAEALDRSLVRHRDAEVRTALAEAQQLVDERLAGLERQIAESQRRYVASVTNMPQRLDSIARLQTRRERLSVEHVGRRLPNSSILR